MARVAKLYPRATLRRTVKKHAKKSLSKNVDILLYLDYVLFVRELISQAKTRAQTRGEKGVSARDIDRVTESCLRKFKG